jgi:hypothetical protein
MNSPGRASIIFNPQERLEGRDNLSTPPGMPFYRPSYEFREQILGGPVLAGKELPMIRPNVLADFWVWL